MLPASAALIMVTKVGGTHMAGCGDRAGPAHEHGGRHVCVISCKDLEPVRSTRQDLERVMVERTNGLLQSYDLGLAASS